MSDVYDMKGEYSEAHKIVARLGGCDAACMAMIDEIHGAPGLAGAFDSWLKTQNVQPGAVSLSLAYARLGRKDQALAWLEKAYEQRSDIARMVFLGVDPQFDPLRSDPRFDVFLRRVGLPPQPHLRSTQTNRFSG
jgi:hypothetical protein